MPSESPTQIRVLIVDDLPLMRELLRRALATDDITVVGEAADGRRGLLEYVALKPDVLVLDVVMPMMDGLTALAKLRRYDPSATVVVCSALGEEALIMKAIRMGAADYVVKPFDPKHVVAAVRKAHRRREALRG